MSVLNRSAPVLMSVFQTHVTQRCRYAPPDPPGRRMIGAAGLERACAVSLARLKRRLELSSTSAV